ncbi:unnamed protein product [Auanema sp. JU1783]|nr:unnamed protein product [Auanema sp. JU1783]
MALLTLLINGVLSGLGAFICFRIVKEYMPIFIQRKMVGNDQCKVSNDPIPEPMGVICAAVYLIILFIFIPIPFLEWIGFESSFPHAKFLAFLSALISICTAILLGFADDVLDLRWRHKLLFPSLSSLPVLMVYYVQGNSTTVVIPSILRNVLEQVVPPAFYGDSFPNAINISFLYYIFMGMVIVFCTNAINILAGINGLESGQSLVIAVGVASFNIIQIIRFDIDTWHQYLSLYFLLPFIACNSVLFYFNKYPAKVFVGDTFCYWAGMTLAVVSILGHFSKTFMLFLIPQIVNFIYSTPQLFHLVPCPRHRLPKFSPKDNNLNMSLAEFKTTDLKFLGKVALKLFKTVGFLHREEFEKDGEKWTRINNLTIINLILYWTGPQHERTLTNMLLGIQVLTIGFAFFVRFYLASIFYEVVN